MFSLYILFAGDGINQAPIHQAHDIDDDFLRACNIPCFDPGLVEDSNLSLLFRLGRPFGPGITQTQFRQVFCECCSCRNLVFVDRRHLHRCSGPALLTQADGFSVVLSLISFKRCPGLSRFDVSRLFTCCDACNRVCLEGTINLHHCPALGRGY